MRLQLGLFFSFILFAVETFAAHPRLDFDSHLDGAIVGASAVGYGTLVVFEEDLAPSKCQWCETNGFDRSIRNKAKWSNTGTANKLSHLTGYGLAPLWALGTHALLNYRDDGFSDFYTDGLIISEAVFVSALAGQITQISVGRKRPSGSSDNTSFYSGHVNIAFALAASSGTVASLRKREEAPYIWTGGLLLAGATAYLRLAADRHYATDVIVGALAGSAIGFSMPYFLHQPKSETAEGRFQLQIVPTHEGAAFAALYRF